jgi:hypothetical protein
MKAFASQYMSDRRHNVTLRFWTASWTLCKMTFLFCPILTTILFMSTDLVKLPSIICWGKSIEWKESGVLRTDRHGRHDEANRCSFIFFRTHLKVISSLITICPAARMRVYMLLCAAPTSESISINLRNCASTGRCTCLAACPPIGSSFHLSINRSTHISVYKSFCPSTRPAIYPFSYDKQS